MEKPIDKTKDESRALLECLERRYLNGAKTLVLDRSEAFLVIRLLRMKRRIETGSEIAAKYIKKYLIEDSN